MGFLGYNQERQIKLERSSGSQKNIVKLPKMGGGSTENTKRGDRSVTEMKKDGKQHSNSNAATGQNGLEKHLRRILNSEDLFAYLKYLNKYGAKDDALMMEDLSYRLDFIKRRQKMRVVEPDQLERQRLHNHLEFNWNLGNKKAMFYNLRRYYELIGKNPFDFIPLTFHIQKGSDDKEYRKFVKFYRQREDDIYKQLEYMEDDDYGKSKPKIKKLRNIWIVKPGEVSNRGTGITVCDDYNDIKKLVCSKEKHRNGSDKTFIVQLYIDRPFLYNKRKFDIRCYMLLTCINGIIRGYWYQEGYIRTSGSIFNLQDVSDVYVHLTNDAIQKYSEDYGRFENGNKLSFSEF